MSGWQDGMKATPFWHEAAPPEAPTGTPAPDETDVAIVGAGYTGLSAALALAGAGRRVAVFEAGPAGAGASTRNGGMIGWGHRAKVGTLAARYGREAAVAMLSEARSSLDFTLALIDRLPGETMYRRTGRFLGAASPRHFDGLASWAREEAPVLGMEVEVIPRAEQHRHIGSDLYHGGLYLPQHGGLHPALFHRALLDATREAGAAIIDHCPVAGVSGAPGRWRVAHGQGETRAAEIVYAGNGYTGGSEGAFGALARRLIPIPSTIIATEVLGRNRMGALFPGGHMVVETRATHGYYRPDPWGERILFGGRASLNVLPEGESARRLRDMMLSIFPDLGDVRLTHSWKGFVAFTFDGVPHAGQMGGVWYACGYNGSGVAMAPYLGWKIAQKVLGLPEGATGFDAGEFRTQALYRGNPWFLSVLELWMKLKDRSEGVAAIRRRS
jgi:glycine/D-amino acid oxidase-like deaminating enzyme